MAEIDMTLTAEEHDAAAAAIEARNHETVTQEEHERATAHRHAAAYLRQKERGEAAS